MSPISIPHLPSASSSAMRIGRHVQQPAMLRLHEALGRRAIQERDQSVVIAVHVEQSVRLRLEAELRPAERLEQLVHRADAARQRQERVRQVAHAHLALRQRLDDLELPEAVVPDLPFVQEARDHADHPTALLERRVRENSHQSDAAAAVYQRPAAARDLAPDGMRSLRVNRIDARRGTAEDADRASRLAGHERADGESGT